MTTPETDPDAPPPLPPARPIDWRISGFVAIDPATFPDTDPVAHRPVKWWNDEPLNTMKAPDNEVRVRPACAAPNLDRTYREMTPLYAETRGAVWCTHDACYGGDADA